MGLISRVSSRTYRKTMIRYSKTLLKGPSPSDYGWKGYAYKKLHDPNKWKAKHHRKKGWNFEEALQYDATTDKWTEQGNPITKFPFNMGFDNLGGPIRHRDHRSQYEDRPVVKVPAYFDYPHQKSYQKHFHNEKALRVYQEVYAKCGPESEEYAFPFDLGDIVEIVSGRAKGERGPICYIDVVHNYILVSGCNIDYSLKATKNGQDPKEVPVLPEHIRLVSKIDKGEVWKNNEDIQIATTYNDRIIWRRNKKTEEILQKNNSKEDPHKNEWVNADAGLHCKIEDYPIGENDTKDYLNNFKFSSSNERQDFTKVLMDNGENYTSQMKSNEDLRKEGKHDQVSEYLPRNGKNNKFALKGPAEMTYQEELAYELDMDLGKPNDTYYY